MGVMVSAEQKRAKERNRDIERQLREEEEKTWQEVKLLLLGAGESGKSTIVKQMQIIHQEGFDRDARLRLRPIVFANALEAMSSMLNAMQRLNIAFDEDARESDAQTVDDARRFGDEPMPQSLVDALRLLWQDGGVRRCYERSNEYQLDDSAKYFLDALDRIGARDYEPSEQDVLRTRVRTTGVIEFNFRVKEMQFRLFDVGGQRSERRKWIHCFDNVTAIIFIVAISEYDQVLREDGVTNRMLESIKLYDSIRNMRYFTDAAIILFLNKRDLFADKLKRSSMQKCFAEYEGSQDYDEASQYITEQFEAINNRANQPSYCHLTCATDTNNVQFVFDAAVDVILANNLKNSGVL